ncbi:MAG: hypothetical protein IKL63_01580 [Alistipes sp.]|nr:hypothetical protein [Alistipes sp.]
MELKKIVDSLAHLSSLVDGWTASKSIPAIERDLALEELRRIYEELLQCSGDTALADSVGEMLSTLPAREAVEEFDDILDIDALLGLNDEEPMPEPMPEPEPIIEPTPEPVIEPEPEPISEPEPAPLPEPEPAPESVPELEPAPEPTPIVEEPAKPQPFGGGLFDIDDIPIRTKRGRKIISLYSSPITQPAPAVEPTPTPEPTPEPAPMVEPAPERQPAPRPITPQPAPTSASAPAPQPAISKEPQVRLGDVLGGSVTVLADKMVKDDAPTPAFNKIDNLRSAIGLNDRFLMIRDLFNGDASKYEDTIETLNEFDDLDECMIYIVENFTWNPDSEGARLLVSLIERKLA